MGRQKLVILGATGSIGVSTLDVVARHPERYEVLALTACRQIERLYEQCCRFNPQYAALASDEEAERLSGMLRRAGCMTTVLAGSESMVRVASLPEADAVMAAIVGAAGLGPTYAAVKAGKKVLLANKESLVMAGPVFMSAVNASSALILPIDSEHNAIFQSLQNDISSTLEEKGVRRIVLTASGGPFRQLPIGALDAVTPDQACAHPNWVMGRKISVDSATMMNKGLEVIEAHWLFHAPRQMIEVLIHPQSVVHSMVEYADGSVIAQLGNPDMRTPIAHALAYPERIDAGVASLDLCQIGNLTFEAIDYSRFPCLGLAYEALERGGNAPAVLNAANEVAVAAFLTSELGFTRIPTIIQQAMSTVPQCGIENLDDVMAADAEARAVARNLVAGLPRLPA